jgi:hypothetical protein
MDPIQPIVPHAPNIPPIAPTPRTTRIEPDARGQGGADPRRPRKRRPASTPVDGADPGVDADRSAEDDGRPHIDVTA